MTPAACTTAAAPILAAALAPSNARLALAGLLAALLVATLVAMRRPFGRLSTIGKCVWLSIAAHVIAAVLICPVSVWQRPQPAPQATLVRITVVPDPVEIVSSPPVPETAPEDLAEWAGALWNQWVRPLAETGFAENQPSDSPPEPPPTASAVAELPPMAELVPPIEPETERIPVPAESAAPDAPLADSAEPLPPIAPEPPAFASAAPAESEAVVDRPEPQADAAERSAKGRSEPTAENNPARASSPAPQAPTAEPPRDDRPTEAAPPLEPVEPNTGFQTRSVDGQPIPDVYALRRAAPRAEITRRNGGNEQTERAVADALRYLASEQEADGRWNPLTTGGGVERRVLGHDRQGAGRDADHALTGLALLAFLGAGHDQAEGEYRDQVRRGLDFLISRQHSSGHLAGEASLFAHMYSHSIATLAVCEAYALTGDPRLRDAVERAVGYSIRAQDPNGGGWRYLPHDPGDMSQFGWQVMALKSAEIAGARLPATTTDGMRRFLIACADRRQPGLAGYRPGDPPSPTMTAESLVCRYFLGEPLPAEHLAQALHSILAERPGSGEVNFYLWYYGTLALRQAGGEAWTRWNAALQSQLLATQVEQGRTAGSWEPNGRWCGYGGRIYSTALATLCLESYYRYQPMTALRSARR